MIIPRSRQGARGSERVGGSPSLTALQSSGARTDLSRAQLHPAQGRGTSPSSWPLVAAERSAVLAGLALPSLSEDKLPP